MAASKRSSRLIVIPALLVALCLTNSASSLTLFDASVSLNNLTNITLIAECQSNGAGIGTFNIPSLGQKNFLSHIIVNGRSVAICSMTLGNLRGNFLVFDWDRDKNKCRDRLCLWHIDRSGL